MISSVSSPGGAEVPAPALRHAKDMEFEYMQKQVSGCLGGRRYVKVEDERDTEPPVCNAGTRQTEKAGA